VLALLWSGLPTVNDRQSEDAVSTSVNQQSAEEGNRPDISRALGQKTNKLATKMARSHCKAIRFDNYQLHIVGHYKQN
jgi:hypothetical protein